MLARLADALRHRARLRSWTSDRATGRRGEDLAHRFLQRLGYRVVGRNWRARSGEIDLIAFDDQTLVFVEVKSRTSSEYGSPERAIGADKIHSLVRAAREYSRRAGIPPERTRFDVVTVVLSEPPALEHLRAAFSATPRFDRQS